MTLVLFILFAAILGSFLASFIYRYVNKNIEKDAFVQSINIYTEPSFCPHCKTKIEWYHLIPVLSYLFLRGKAKCCGATISSRYFFTEILVISLFLLIIIIPTPLRYFSLSRPGLYLFIGYMTLLYNTVFV